MVYQPPISGTLQDMALRPAETNPAASLFASPKGATAVATKGLLETVRKSPKLYATPTVQCLVALRGEHPEFSLAKIPIESRQMLLILRLEEGKQLVALAQAWAAAIAQDAELAKVAENRRFLNFVLDRAVRAGELDATTAEGLRVQPLTETPYAATLRPALAVQSLATPVLAPAFVATSSGVRSRST